MNLFSSIAGDIETLQREASGHMEEAEKAKASLDQVKETQYKEFCLKMQALDTLRNDLATFETEFSRNASQADLAIPLSVQIGGSLSKKKIKLELDLGAAETSHSASLQGYAVQIGTAIISAQRERIQAASTELHSNTEFLTRFQQEQFAANRREAYEPQ